MDPKTQPTTVCFDIGTSIFMNKKLSRGYVSLRAVQSQLFRNFFFDLGNRNRNEQMFQTYTHLFIVSIKSDLPLIQREASLM